MAIRWVSNPDSIRANQPSVLAIAETLAAMGISVWIAVTWDTYLHIAIGASIAPLLLMRTDASCRRGSAMALKLCVPAFKVLNKLKDEAAGFQLLIVQMARLLVLFVWFPIAFVLARIAGCVLTLVQHPLVALAEIPGNWGHATVVLDSKKWPDIMPTPREGRGAEGAADVGQLLKAGGLLSCVLWTPVILSAFVYRWSLKSTAIIWFPLLWAMHSVREAGIPLRKSLDIYLRDPITVFVLLVSIATIIGVAAKIVLFNEWAGFVEWWNTTPMLRFFSLYVTPAEIQWWQVAMVVNSAIAIAMYILAHRWLARIEHDELTDEARPRRLFQVGRFIHPILSCYTIACTLYITIRAASDWELPALGTRPVPWM